MAKKYFPGKNRGASLNLRRVETEIIKNRERRSKAQVLFLDGDFDNNDYKELKGKITQDLQNLEIEKSNLTKLDSSVVNQLKSATYLLENLDGYCKNSQEEFKQKLMDSLFEGNLTRIYRNFPGRV